VSVWDVGRDQPGGTRWVLRLWIGS
jgi:hypothetical protein